MSAWTLPGRFGAEEWRADAAGFRPVAVGGATVDNPADAALLDRIGVRDTLCADPGPLPNAFRFCPHCGAGLAEAPPADRSAPWPAPFGGADGLPDRAVEGAPDPATIDEIPMPSSAANELFVAGTPARLLCADRASGWISAFSGRDNSWHRLLQVAEGVRLGRESWAAVATERGVALPTDRGPVWIALAGAIGTSIVAPAEPCAPLAGPMRIGTAILLPVIRDETLRIALFDGATWRFLPVSGVSVAAITPFCSPAAASETALWWNRVGQLAVSDTVDGFEARFTAWSDGVRPLEEARPIVGRDGLLHLPCRLDRNTLVHEALLLPGQSRGRRIARGYTPGTGRAVFRENTRLRLPWDERAACDYPLDDDRFIHPLLALGEHRFVLAVCSDRARMGTFGGDPLIPPTPELAPLNCIPCYSRGPRMIEPLDCVLRAHRAGDLRALVHGGRLLIHGAPENRCFRWELRRED